jgi:hypothetical protein
MATILRRQQQRKDTKPQRLTPAAMNCRKKFLRFFGDGFRDETYHAWERDYKAAAHKQWVELLGQETYRRLLDAGEYAEIAARATRIESRTNLLFSFEKMALRDAVRTPVGAKAFATGLYDFLYGPGLEQERFERLCQTVAELPRKQTRVLTWPLVTVFGFMADPSAYIFLKPNVTRLAAKAYGYDFEYASKPNWNTYRSLVAFADRILREQRDLHPRDMVDAQSFMWVQGSDEYEE